MIDLRIEKIKYEVDEAMLGECWNEDGTDELVDFCSVLQRLCEEKCLFVEISPITSSWNGANNDPNVYDNNGNLVSVQWFFENIPFLNALDKYHNEKQE